VDKTATGCDIRVSNAPRKWQTRGTYTNGDILGSSKSPVEEIAHEGRIQTKLNREISKLCVSHALGYNDSSDSHSCFALERKKYERYELQRTGNNISGRPSQVVAWKPAGGWKQRLDVVDSTMGPWADLLDPIQNGGFMLDVPVCAGDGEDGLPSLVPVAVSSGSDVISIIFTLAQ
jgi:hypothetical protein